MSLLPSDTAINTHETNAFFTQDIMQDDDLLHLGQHVAGTVADLYDDIGCPIDEGHPIIKAKYRGELLAKVSADQNGSGLRRRCVS